jgi:hypothetical protein
LEKIIAGYEPEFTDGTKKGIVSIEFHFRRRLSWMNERRCLTVRFEDLIGSAGGGDSAKQIAQIRIISDFLNININERDIYHIKDNIFSSQTATFRKGQVGSWREEFSDEHKIVFKDVAGQLLVDLGYEKDFNW